MTICRGSMNYRQRITPDSGKRDGSPAYEAYGSRSEDKSSRDRSPVDGGAAETHVLSTALRSGRHHGNSGRDRPITDDSRAGSR